MTFPCPPGETGARTGALRQEIARAADYLRAGKLVAFPTETVYGLGADAENELAVRRIFEAKGRPSAHPLIIHIGEPDSLDRWVIGIPDTARVLARIFWPGPLTLVLRRGSRISYAVTGGLETVAVRVPDHPIALDLLRSFGSAIAAPSANRFGRVSPTCAEHVREDLGASVDLVLDGGPCGVGVESTIVDLSSDAPSILRPGGVTPEQLEQVLGKPIPIVHDGAVRSPGQHPLHYAPRASVEVVSPQELYDRAAWWQARGHRVAVLCEPSDLVPPGVDLIPLAGPLDAVARSLYESLREVDRRGCDIVVVAERFRGGLGCAIADRLARAAGPRVSTEEGS